MTPRTRSARLLSGFDEAGVGRAAICFFRCRSVALPSPVSGSVELREAGQGEAGSPRLVPLHSDLLRLGLLESRVFNRDPDDLLIFDEVLTGSPRQQKLQFKSLASRQGRLFSRFKAHYGLRAHKKTLHSFRRRVQTFLQRAEVADGIISAIIGYTEERRPEVKASYDHGYTLQQLKPAIEKLVLPIDMDLLVEARDGRMRGETR